MILISIFLLISSAIILTIKNIEEQKVRNESKFVQPSLDNLGWSLTGSKIVTLIAGFASSGFKSGVFWKTNGNRVDQQAGIGPISDAYKTMKPVFPENKGIQGQLLVSGESKQYENIQKEDLEDYPLREFAEQAGIKSVMQVKVPGGLIELASEKELPQSNELESISDTLKTMYEKEIIYPSINNINLNIPQETYFVRNNKGLDAAMFNNQNNQDNLIIFFHGNNDQLAFGSSMFTREFETYNPEQTVLCPEYSSRGISEQPNDYNINKKDLNDSNQALIEKFIDDKYNGVLPKNLVLVGHSLGSAQSVQALERIQKNQNVQNVKMVLISPFTTIVELSQDTIEMGNVINYNQNKMIKDNWNIRKRKSLLQQTNGVLIIHGDKDRIVPYHFGKTLAEEIQGSHFKTMPGVGHNFKKPEVRRELFEEIQQFIINDESNKPESKENQQEYLRKK